MKILMTLMGLDIGGAETHVIELSKALSGMGHKITVASNGGVYVKELEAASIPHVKLPLHTKNPFAVIKSYFSLKKLIKKEGFDIVHAHARIPAFICGLLQRKLGFRFVTSAHGVYKINPLWRNVTNWGEKCVAVSDDIKQYVVEKYGYCADNVSVTINGIDTGRYSKDVGHRDVLKELAMNEKARRIVCVSRLDSPGSAVPALLCGIAPALKERFSDIEIVIAGGGSELEKIRSLAKKADNKAGVHFVSAIGARTDINRIIAACDLFVGVSRAALEAMSASKPVLLAGAEGYIGVFGKDKLELSADTNFCCRGCPPATADALLHDLSELLGHKKETLDSLGEYNRSVVMSGYSVERMVSDYLDVYEKLTPYKLYKHGDIVISGYYGYGNTGDDSLLLSMTENLRAADPYAKITVITKSPKKTAARFGVRCIGRTDIFAIRSELAHARLLLVGGGSILQNSSSNRSLFYYTSVIKLAKKLGAKIMLYANGIGPLIGERSKKRALAAIRRADYISLREPSSLDEIARLGADTKKAVVSADPALLLSPAPKSRIKYVCKKAGFVDGRHYFAVSVREWKKLRNLSGAESEKRFERTLADAINAIADITGACPVFIPMQPSRDGAICDRIRSLCTRDSIKLSSLTARELIGVLKKTDFVIGMRLHMLIYATCAGVPALGISYDPKIDAFLEYSGQPDALDVRNIKSEEIISALEKILGEREEIKKKLEEKCEEFGALAKLDAKTATELARSGK